MNLNDLTRYERAIYRELERSKGEVVSRDTIYGALKVLQTLDGREPAKTNSLEVMVGRLRRKSGLQIKAIRDKGYVLIGGKDEITTEKSNDSRTLAETPKTSG